MECWLLPISSLVKEWRVLAPYMQFLSVWTSIRMGTLWILLYLYVTKADKIWTFTEVRNFLKSQTRYEMFDIHFVKCLVFDFKWDSIAAVDSLGFLFESVEPSYNAPHDKYYWRKEWCYCIFIWKLFAMSRDGDGDGNQSTKYQTPVHMHDHVRKITAKSIHHIEYRYHSMEIYGKDIHRMSEMLLSK